MRHVLPAEARHAARALPASPIISPELRTSLVELAQLALAAATGLIEVSDLSRALERTRDGDLDGVVFVTLTSDGELRGCMGNLDPGRRLSEAVVTSAIAAALDDPRFLPLVAAELPTIHVDISVLGPAVPIVDADGFEPGVDGVIVERSGRRGLLLPEVATEFGWSARQLFDAVCRKAGLPLDAWHDPRTQLSAFRTIRFGGPATPATSR